jgi:hypothetical protein
MIMGDLKLNLLAKLEGKRKVLSKIKKHLQKTNNSKIKEVRRNKQQ